MEHESALLVTLQTPIGDWVDVGYLRNFREKNWFEFAASYWDLPDRPVLGQIFEERGRNWRPSARVALPNWFSHLLPEGRLRLAVANAAHTNSKREFNLLARIGRDDLPGAVRMSPAAAPTSSVTPADHLETADEPDDADDPLLKFSLAGVQLKFSVYQGQKGLAVPAKGRAGNVVLKFPDDRPGYAGVPEAELACL
jgi:serine/threonine-protein kinase HipA